jgi:uncharacterized UBP type Zn finger protein
MALPLYSRPGGSLSLQFPSRDRWSYLDSEGCDLCNVPGSLWLHLFCGNLSNNQQ